MSLTPYRGRLNLTAYAINLQMQLVSVLSVMLPQIAIIVFHQDMERR
jgi:hypothetical protein